MFTYLRFLTGVSSDILLGNAAVVLPIREPLLAMKAAASVDLLSGGRVLLGVASGDRPVGICNRNPRTGAERNQQALTMQLSMLAS